MTSDDRSERVPTEGTPAIRVWERTGPEMADDAMRRALRGEPGARAADAQAERWWALDVLAGILRGAGDARPAGDAPGARGEP